MEFATATNCGTQLCELFGLQANTVASLSIIIQPESIVEVQAKMYLTKDQILEAVEIIKNYKLEPIVDSDK